MAKYRTYVWVEEVRVKEFIVDAESREEANLIAAKAIDDAAVTGDHKAWQVETQSFDSTWYGPLEDKQA